MMPPRHHHDAVPVSESCTPRASRRQTPSRLSSRAGRLLLSLGNGTRVPCILSRWWTWKASRCCGGCRPRRAGLSSPSLSARHLLSSLGGPATLPSSLSAGRRRVSPRLTAVPGVSLARARETTRRTRHRGHTDARDASACTLHLPRRCAACACHSATSLCLRSLRRQRQRRRTARDTETRAPLGATGGAADPQALTDGAAGGASDCLRRLRTAATHCSEYAPRQPLDSEPHAPHQRETGGGRRQGERADAARDKESEQTLRETRRASRRCARQPETWRS